MNSSSSVNSVLAVYGFEWTTHPYRIVDVKTQVIVAKGPDFNLTEDSLKALRAAFDRRGP